MSSVRFPLFRLSVADAGRAVLDRRDLLIAALLFTLALWQLLPGVTATPFHRDEARWVHRVYYLKEWRHPLGPRWQDNGYPIDTGSLDERFRMRGQPPFAPYVFGLGLLLHGRDLTTNGFWIMDRDDGWNTIQGHMPTAADLRAARRANVVVGALTVVAVYFIGKRLTNRIGGAFGAIVLAVHPLLNDTATRVWSDPLMVLLIALAVIAAYRLVDRPSWSRALLLGALLGLGGATKLSPLLVSLPLAGLGLILIAERCLRRPRAPAVGRDALGWKLLAVPLFAYAVFVASYPYFWPDPIGRTRTIFEFRADSFRTQAAAFPQAEVRGQIDAFRRIGDELGARFSVTGRLVAELERHAGITIDATRRPGELDLAIAALGLVLFVALVALRGLRSAHCLAAVVLGGQVAITILPMGVEYARYMLPVLLAVVVCIGIVAGQTWTMLHRLAVRRVTPERLASPITLGDPTTGSASP